MNIFYNITFLALTGFLCSCQSIPSGELEPLSMGRTTLPYSDSVRSDDHGKEVSVKLLSNGDAFYLGSDGLRHVLLHDVSTDIKTTRFYLDESGAVKESGRDIFLDPDGRMWVIKDGNKEYGPSEIHGVGWRRLKVSDQDRDEIPPPGFQPAP